MPIITPPVSSYNVTYADFASFLTNAFNYLSGSEYPAVSSLTIQQRFDSDNNTSVPGVSSYYILPKTALRVVSTGTTVIGGINDAGNAHPFNVDTYGHLEVAVHTPRLPFGSIHAESLHPIFQTDAVYGINPEQVNITSTGSGSAIGDNSMFTCYTGTNIYSFGALQSRKRLRYRAGQGVVTRFTGFFSTGVANSIQVIGCGHAEDGFYFAMSGTDFGILYNNRGVRETRTLTVATSSTSTAEYQITLNNIMTPVSATANNSPSRTAWEISQGNYPGWQAEAYDSTVIFIKNSVGQAGGTYSLAQSGAGTPVIGTFSLTKAGSATIDTWIPQSIWNGDKLDGTGNTGATIDPTKGNVYQIGIQYLGSGPITFSVEVAPDNNNPEFVEVHTIRNVNLLSATTLGNPSFPFTMAAYSAGSTTDISVKSGSFAGFVEGQRLLHGPRFSYSNTSTNINSSVYGALFTVQNKLFYKNRANQAVVNILSILGALKHTQPGTIYLIKNGILVGNVNFVEYAPTSCTNWDTSATSVSIADNSNIVWSGPLAETSSLKHEFKVEEAEITLQPGEWVTVAAKASTGTPSYVSGSINTREDQ